MAHGGALMNTVVTRPTRFGQHRRLVSPAGANRSMVSAGFLILLIMMVLGPYMSFGVAPFTGDGNPARQAFYILALLLVLLGVRPWQHPGRVFALPLCVLIVLGWCWFTVSWSISPGIAVRRLILTTAVMMTVFIAVKALGFRTSLFLFRCVLVGALIGNWLFVLFVPQIGIHQMDEAGDSGIVGAWCGMMLHKNFAGAACAATILMFVFAWESDRRLAWLRWLVIVATVVFLWGTQSKTSAGLGAIGLIVGWLYSRFNPRHRVLLIPAVMILAVALIFLGEMYWNDATAILYNPTAFTGRTQIWPPLVVFAADHPWGAGYGSFWNIGVGLSPIFHYSRGWVTEQGQGHNGYLDLAITIGLPGLVIVIVCLIVWPIARLLASADAQRGQGAVGISLIVFSAGHNFTESTMLDRDQVGQIVLMFAVAVALDAARRVAPVKPTIRRLPQRG